jgi:predicted nucleotidyltransferase
MNEDITPFQTPMFQSLCNRIANFGREHRQIVAIYLFGSIVAIKQRMGSDIDIAIMVRGSVGRMERVEAETFLSNLLNRDVDLVIFGDASPLLRHQILKYSHLVFESDPQERVRQEVAARREYLDSLTLYKVIEG